MGYRDEKRFIDQITKNEIQNSLKLAISFLSNSLKNDINIIDLRQGNQIIVNE